MSASRIWKACKKKIKYPTALAAQEAMIATTFKYGCACHAYRCSYCDGWHLATHDPTSRDPSNAQSSPSTKS